VAVRVLPSPSPEVHHAGVRRLLLLNVSSPVKAVSGLLNNRAKLTLATYGKLTELMDDAIAASVDALAPEAPRTAAGFEELLPVVRAGLQDQLLRVLRDAEEVLRHAAEVDAAVSDSPAGRSVRAQREALVHPGFLTEVGAARLPDLLRYLKAMRVRLEKAPRDPSRDALHQSDVDLAVKEWAQLPPGPLKEQVRWMVEELRVSLFAPSVKAKGPISLQRIYKAIDAAG
jgi:ATP-dependent helicase HrpA